MKLIENLQWRYATKKFDPEKSIADVDMEKLKKAIQLSASSYGLQPYKVLIISNPDIRKKLLPVSWKQSQVSDAHALLVFCNYKTIGKNYLDNFKQIKANVEGKEVSDLDAFGDFVLNKLSEKSANEMENWTAKQCYLALGNLLAACAELKIDACPMEGFDNEAYNDILGLDSQGLNAAVIATIGYRSSDDNHQNSEKVRVPNSELFQNL